MPTSLAPSARAAFLGGFGASDDATCVAVPFDFTRPVLPSHMVKLKRQEALAYTTRSSCGDA
eukprot:6101193-Prymnesium_polylepis.1